MEDKFNLEEFIETSDTDENKEATRDYLMDVIEKMRPKYLVENPEKIAIAKKTYLQIKKLLDEESVEYKIDAKTGQLSGTEIFISITADELTVRPDFFHIYKDMVSNLSGISYCGRTDGKIRIQLRIDNAYIDVGPKPEIDSE